MRRVGEKENIYRYKEENKKLTGTSMSSQCLLMTLIEGMVEGIIDRGRSFTENN